MENDLDGIFDTLQHEEKAPVPAKEVPETKTETEASTAETSKTNTEEVTETEATEEAKAETGTEATTTETTEPLKTETQTEAETVDWKATLPPPPAPVQLVEPVLDEDGNITNMNAAQYEEYILQKAENRLSQKMYQNYVENAALEQAEKILPEIKTNPAVRQMVESIRVASVLNGTQVDAVTAAQQVRDLIGASKAEGVQSAKTSITIQKQSAVETNGATKTKPTPSKTEALDKRLKAGDDEAFAELLTLWDEEGKI